MQEKAEELYPGLFKPIMLTKSRYNQHTGKYANIIEVGATGNTLEQCLNSMKLSELFTILNTRLLNLNNKVTKTIISTNLGINNIFRNYEERIGSRIAGFYDIYYFFGDDLRLSTKH